MLPNSCRGMTTSESSFCTKHKHKAQYMFEELNQTSYFNLLMLQMGKLRAREKVTCNGHSMYLIRILLLQVGKRKKEDGGGGRDVGWCSPNGKLSLQAQVWSRKVLSRAGLSALCSLLCQLHSLAQLNSHMLLHITATCQGALGATRRWKRQRKSLS